MGLKDAIIKNTEYNSIVVSLGTAIGASWLDDSEIGSTVEKVTRSLLLYDNLVVFAYRSNERPLHLFSTLKEDERRILVDLYQAGPFLLDPFYHASRERREGLFRMRELAPDRFYKSEYARNYYGQTGVAEEVGILVPLEGEIGVCLSFMRSESSGSFRQNEIIRFRSSETLVTAIVRRFWADLRQRFDMQQHSRKRKGKLAPSLQPADAVWQDLNLTKREIAVIELVLQGHSSEAIALRLEIAIGTVKVHRKNVYRKLGICSQTQLLFIYLTAVKHRFSNN